MADEGGHPWPGGGIEDRVLVLPPTRADAVAINDLLTARHIGCAIMPDLVAICSAVRAGAGVLLVSEEALSADASLLTACLAAQEVWSDLPVIVLSRSGAESVALTRILPGLGNVTVLERPVRTTTLVSLVRSSLRARARQYQVRAHLLEQAHTQTLLREAELTERTARNEAERSSRIKDEFLATLSHELRTPLHAILGWSQLMRKSPDLSSKVAEGLSVIERSARSQARIISDLLDMSSIISGKVRLDVQRADLAGIVEAAVDTVRPAAQAKEIALRVVLDPLARPVRGDPSRLQQILWNLLTNAVKFTPKGGRVSVSLERVNSHLEINIEDSGEGIDPEFLPYVFDRFRQADSSAGRMHGGLGLGLSIVKQLVELHGGMVSAKSHGKGAGSNFRISLPLMATIEDPHDANDGRRHPAHSGTVAMVPEIPRPDLKGFTLLVVDDEPDARSLIARLLEECAATVFMAASAEEALVLLAQHQPDLLISDIGMPGEDGYSFIRRVRSLGDSRNSIPAIALTAYARTEDRVKAIEAGYQMHLAKPVEPVELIAMVSSWQRQAARHA